MRYPGGKFRCFQKLINMMPEHRVYIETHLGGGAVIRNKRAAHWNVGIEIDPSIFDGYKGQFGNNFSFINGRAEDYLEKYQFQGDELLFVDPPYYRSCCRSKRSPYRFGYTDEDHEFLLSILQTLPAKVMICGYDNNLYQHMLHDWRKIHFQGTSHVGRREETVWLNYEPRTLHDTNHLGASFRERQAIKRKRARWVSRFQSEPIPVQQAILTDLAASFRQLHTNPSSLS